VRNNHYYWEGLAVAATGAVTGDERLLAWGRKVFDHAMSQVAPDGSLPLEMERAAKALHYHSFAVQPLVMLASILDVQSPRLDQLVRFTLQGIADPSAIEKATGIAQERIKGTPGWKIVYDRHTRRGGRPAHRLLGALGAAHGRRHRHRQSARARGADEQGAAQPRPRRRRRTSMRASAQPN
jgi:hypothetical protein